MIIESITIRLSKEETDENKDIELLTAKGYHKKYPDKNNEYTTTLIKSNEYEIYLYHTLPEEVLEEPDSNKTKTIHGVNFLGLKSNNRHIDSEHIKFTEENGTYRTITKILQYGKKEQKKKVKITIKTSL